MPDPLRSISDDERRLFASRIAKSLVDNPLILEVGAHRERVATLLREVGEPSYYDLLGIGPAAPVPEIHQAYEKLARVVHPQHAPRLGLEGKEGVLEVLFDRATLAYLTLSHPDRRKAHDREVGADGPVGSGGAGSRADENRERARHLYLRASALAAEEEFHFAIEMAREATRIDPRAEYFALLGDLLAKNDRWLFQAVECYTRALAMGGPADVLTASLQEVRDQIANRGSRGDRAEKDEASSSGRRKP